MKQYNVTIVRVRRNTGPVGGPFVCERGSWQQDTLRGKRDCFRVIETIKVGTEAECRQAARGCKEYAEPEFNVTFARARRDALRSGGQQ